MILWIVEPCSILVVCQHFSVLPPPKMLPEATAQIISIHKAMKTSQLTIVLSNKLYLYSRLRPVH